MSRELELNLDSQDPGLELDLQYSKHEALTSYITMEGGEYTFKS